METVNHHPRITMKTFAGIKPLKTIREQCAAAGVAVDDYHWRKNGQDTVVIGQQSGTRPDGTPLVVSSFNGESCAYVILNTATGRFEGKTDKGVKFDSSEKQSSYENESWFQTLQSFFYIEKTE